MLLFLYFGLLSGVTFSEMKLISMYQILGDHLIGIKKIENPSLGGPKGGHGCFKEVAGL